MSCAVLCVLTSAAVAHGESFALEWQAPAPCPQQARVREQIRALVPAALADAGTLRAEGRISRVKGRFRLRLNMHFGSVNGERIIESSSCEDLAGAAAVALGLLIQSADATNTRAADGPPSSRSSDANAGRGADPKTGREAPTDAEAFPEENAVTGSRTGAGRTATSAADSKPRRPPSKNEGPAELSAPTESASASRARNSFVLKAAEGVLQVGPLPRPTFAVSVGAGLAIREFRALLGLQLALPQTVALGDAGARVELRPMALELMGCRAWSFSALEVGPCLTVALERLTAQGSGERIASRTDSAVWLSLGATATARVHVTSWFALSAGLGGKLAAARPRIRIDGVDDAEQLGPAALTLRSSAEWMF